jgi:hypothetical protein
MEGDQLGHTLSPSGMLVILMRVPVDCYVMPTRERLSNGWIQALRPFSPHTIVSCKSAASAATPAQAPMTAEAMSR